MIILLLIFSSFSFLPYFHSNRVLFLIINLLIINLLIINYLPVFRDF